MLFCPCKTLILAPMKLLSIPATLALLLLYACNGTQTPNPETAFESYKERVVLQFWKQYPAWASSVGYHHYDSVLSIPDAATREKELAFCQQHLDSLHGFELKALSANNKTDYYMLENFFRSTIWGQTHMRAWEWNPSDYNLGSTFADMLNNNYAPLKERLTRFYQRLAYVPAYFATAKQNIKNPTTEHTQLAIDQNTGGLSIFQTDFMAAVDTADFTDAEKTSMKTRAREAVAAIQSYITWLKGLTHTQPRSFRLGKELYQQKFEYDIQSGFKAEEIYQKALAHKKDLHRKMYVLANQLWPTYMGKQQKPADTLQLIKAVINQLSLKHVQPDSFQAAIEQQIPVLTSFISNKNLIYIDPSKPLVVRREPDYMAGVAGASISAPGPYDKGGNTYYNVGSLSGWDKTRAESYLREYNHYILQILNIHEAIPGHYTQLVYSNQSPSIIKSILGNGAMIEGWAVYTEKMMLENGYGADEKTGEVSPEMWLMYYKWNLRSTCNTILDYSVHVNNMSKEEALHLLVDEAFQQQAEAEGKWKRVTLTQVQLCSYFTGFMEIYEFREELKKKQGETFNLKNFHEKFLSYGSAPVKYIRELMMQ